MYYILTRENCQYCDKAKDLLDENGEDYQVFSISDSPVYVRLMIKADLKTVPQIWHNADYIGGYDQLKEYLNDL